MAIPFQIRVPEAEINHLRSKLELARLPNELEDAGWKYGVPLVEMRRLVDRWKNGFDWRVQESKINEMPQFTRKIQVAGHGPLRIHFVHKPSSVTTAIPLLFVHGCMSVFRRGVLLSDPNAAAVLRARKLFGGSKDSAVADCSVSAPSEFPRRRLESARIRFLRSAEEMRLWFAPIRRGQLCTLLLLDVSGKLVSLFRWRISSCLRSVMESMSLREGIGASPYVDILVCLSLRHVLSPFGADHPSYGGKIWS